MTIEELRALLEAGKLTKEQFSTMAKAIDPDYTEPVPEDNTDPEPEQKPEPDLEAAIQKAVDRATNKLGNENKKLREQLEKLKKSKLTAEEAAEMERQERENDLAAREKALLDKENRLYAIKSIKAAGLDDGSDKALELVDFVMADTEEDIDDRTKALAELVQKLVKSEVERKFKDSGRNPGKGGGAGEANPWAKETRNITEQMRLEISDPERARQLKAAAGVK